MNVPSGASISVPSGGAVALGCTNLSVQGNLAIGSGAVNQGATVSIASTGYVNAGQGTINVGVGWNNNGNFDPGTSTVVIDDGCGFAQFLFTGKTTFYNLILRSNVGRTFVIPAGVNLTVLGKLTLQGAPGLPIQLVSSTGAPAVITLVSGAQVASTNATLSPSVQTVTTTETSVPTLNQYGLALTVLLLLAVGLPKLRKRIE